MGQAGSTLVRWVGGGIVAGALWLGGQAAWLAARAPAASAAGQRATQERLGAEKARLGIALADYRQRTAKLAADAALEAGRARDAERALRALRAKDSWWRDTWNRWFGDAREVRSKDDREARLEATKTAAAARAAELHTAWTRATWEQDGAEIELARVGRELAAAGREGSATRHYLALAWARSRGYLVAALAVWFAAGAAACDHRRRRPSSAPGSGIAKS